MKKRKISLFLLFFLCLVFPSSGNAAVPSLPDDPAQWDSQAQAPLSFVEGMEMDGTFSYTAEQAGNTFLFYLVLNSLLIRPDSSISAQIVLNGENRWAVDLANTQELENIDGISAQCRIEPAQSGGRLCYTAALTLPEPAVYQVFVSFLLDGREFRVSTPLTINTTLPVSIRETTTKSTVTKAGQNMFATDKTTKAKSVAPKQAVTKSNAKAGLGSRTAAETTDTETAYQDEAVVFPQSSSFFEKMSKPAKVVLIAAVVLGALALVTVGAALGSQMAHRKRKEGTTGGQEEEPPPPPDRKK